MLFILSKNDHDLYLKSLKLIHKIYPLYLKFYDAKALTLIGESGKREVCKLWDTIRDQSIADYRTFDLPARGSRPARKVIQSIQAQTVCLHPPIGRRGKLRMKPISVNGVIAREVNPPAGEKPIEWLLLTNLEIDTSEKRQAILQYYICRWQIEVFFRILKSGCKIEKLQLNCDKRYGPCLAFYLIIAWRILYLIPI